jgi:ribonuclease Z
MNKITRHTLLGTLATFLVGFIYLYTQDFRPIIYKAAAHSVNQIVTDNQENKNAFKLLFCGTGSPNRTPERGQPCTALIADGKLFLFDAGEGAISKLSEYGAPLAQLQGIFLTHLHSDHISGVAEVLHNTWLYGRQHTAEIIGPPGTESMINHFEKAYAEDLHERMRVLGKENLNNDTTFAGARDVSVTGEESTVVYDNNGLVIRAFTVEHPDWPHAYGYRIEYRNKVIVISGDTRPSKNLVKHSKGADYLIHEALNTEIFNYVGKQMDLQGGPISQDRLDLIAEVHTSTLDLAELASEAAVDNLVITHLIPAIPANWISNKFFTSDMDDIYSGNIVVARDGQYIEIPTTEGTVH